MSVSAFPRLKADSLQSTPNWKLSKPAFGHLARRPRFERGMVEAVHFHR
jgi:hypothetical protein